MNHLHFPEGADTFWAVVLGAVLATVGGFLSSQLEANLNTRAKERNAALLFGEILSTIELMFAVTDEARGRGERYGPVTMRMVRALQRELQLYERQRDLLYDLREPKMRACIHGLMVRVGLAVDGVLDATLDLERVEAQLGQGGGATTELAAQRTLIDQRRETAFNFGLETTARIPEALEQLSLILKKSFEGHAEAGRALTTTTVPEN